MNYLTANQEAWLMAAEEKATAPGAAWMVIDIHDAWESGKRASDIDASALPKGMARSFKKANAEASGKLGVQCRGT